MDEEIKAQWVEALRSGQYRQARGVLSAKQEDGSMTHCCLGVLCELLLAQGRLQRVEADGVIFYGTSNADMNNALLPEGIVAPLGLGDGYRSNSPTIDFRIGSADLDHVELVEINDGAPGKNLRKHTFNEIADIIESSEL